LLPAPIAATIGLPLIAWLGWAYAVPLIPFALRFPADARTPQLPRADRMAWLAFALMVCAGCAFCTARWLGHVGDVGFAASYVLPALALPIAALILVRTYVVSDSTVRAQTAWAIAGFAGAFICGFAGKLPVLLS
jgi:hypothetical protein